jgi:hypothetical protein
MNFKRALLSLLFLAQLAVGQTKYYVNYNWEKKPVLTTPNPAYKEYDHYVTYENHVIEYAYDSNDEVALFETRHVIFHINTDKGVEMKNKMYIPSGKIIEMIDLKARCITSTGKVINLDKGSVKHVDNFEDQGPYTIFAFEGVEPNSDIEYMYTAKKYVSMYGSYDTQFSFPEQKADVHFISPKNLVFEVKGYNGFPAFVKDTSDQKVNHLVAKAQNIEEFTTEKYSADDANRQRFDFHLRYNTAKSNAKYYTWNIIGNDFITTYYSNTKDDIKAVAKAIDKSGAAKKSTDLEKITAFENYIKKTIVFSDEAPSSMTIEKALSQKLTDNFNLNRMFVEASKQLGLNPEMVFVKNRYEGAFDPAFEGYHQLKEILIYYPSMDKYLAPANYFSRIGFPPTQYILNQALFLKATEVAGITAGIAKVKPVGAPDNSLSQSIMNVKVSFEGDDFTPKTEMEHQYSGYDAYSIQPVYYIMNDEQKKETAENILKQVGENTVVKSYKVANAEADDILKKPMIVSGTIETPMLIEKAGNKFLYKIGLIIGPQSELYQEKPRKTDVVPGNPHGYVRNIEVTIPEGYKVSNTDALNFNVVLNDNGKESCYFKSSYKLEGNKLSVTVSEQYIGTFYPKEKYKEFKDVINAAADFNKVTLIFEKK